MSFTSEEIYPNIVVYNNVLDDPERMFSILKESETAEDGFFQWEKWSRFGTYITKYPYKADPFSTELKVIEQSVATNKTEEDHMYFISELTKGLFTVNNDYFKKYNISIDTERLVSRDPVSGEQYPAWKWAEPNICSYNITDESHNVAMNYHSDYQREPILSPGYKFTITSLCYFNDDYRGGAIDFAVGKKLIGYKPKAGDFVVFPSGHPEVLTEDGTVYLHAVKPILNSKKYFSRSYWLKYSPASEEWVRKEKHYGRELWESMQQDIMDKYNEEHRQRNYIEGGIRLR